MNINDQTKISANEFHKQYLQGVKRTERSVIHENVEARDTLKFMEAFERLADELGRIKKSIFYNKPFDSNGIEIDTLPLYTKSPYDRPRLLHAILGMADEVGELVSAFLASVDSGHIDEVNFKEELGDFMFYAFIALDDLQMSFSDVLVSNNKKLSARYTNGFSEHEAVNRDFKKERSALENL